VEGIGGAEGEGDVLGRREAVELDRDVVIPQASTGDLAEGAVLAEVDVVHLIVEDRAFRWIDLGGEAPDVVGLFLEDEVEVVGAALGVEYLDAGLDDIAVLADRG